MSQQVHQQFGVDLDQAKYAQSLAHLESSTKTATGRAANSFSAIDNAAKQSTYRFGQVSLQAADVAVQLEGGASAARVLAQQGSQIASIFGPQGMILGAVIAIGAGIYSWASGAKDANAELKETMRLLGERQKRGAAIRDETVADAKAAERAKIGGSRAELETLRLDYEEKKKAMEKEFTDTPIRQRDYGMQERREAEARNRYEAEKMALLDKYSEERSEKEEKAAAKKASEEEAAMRKKHREFEQMQDAEAKRIDDFAKQREQEDKKWRSEFDKSVAQADKIAELQKDRLETEKEITIELKKRNAMESVNRGEATLEKAADIMKSPAERAAARGSANREDRAKRSAIGQEIERRDAFNRRNGGSGLTQKEKDDIRRERNKDVQNAKNKDKVMAAIEPDSIEKLSAKLQEVIEKLITK